MRCLICKSKESTQENFPFCSKRCADIDLYFWFNGNYKIPSENPLTEEELEKLEILINNDIEKN